MFGIIFVNIPIMMKRHISILILAVAATVAAIAQTPAQMLDRCAAAMTNAGGLSATYTLTAPAQGSDRGTIVMQGRQFRLLSSLAKCWFDGTTMWSYSPATGEVNVTNPTAQELQMTNPLSAVQGFKSNFNLKRAKCDTPNTYVIKLTPKQKSNIKVLWVYFDTTTNLLRTARFEMQDGSLNIIKLTNFQSHQKFSASTFKYDKSLVPAGTQVVDLR